LGRATTTTSGGLYQRTQLPATFKPSVVYVTNNAGKLLGQTDTNNHSPLVASSGWGNPAIVLQDLAIVPDPYSFVVSGRVLPPATPPTKPVAITVSVEAYDTGDTIVASGQVQSNGYGDYRVEAKPTRAFTPTRAAHSMRISRFVIKLTENGTLTDTTVTNQERIADGHNIPTRDLHG
jgi:hypothetical protein